ncbi:unnamed protein product [Protopolystoma xenopodis]|uniref:Rho-GAP domain-containing protein n=1 Tax=Protopolystoma xenopodis TaxID=117903 RepID=A0A3S5AIT1_9PLAT|nr:unnamed protein product [Protopolystoma xenopodis]
MAGIGSSSSDLSASRLLMEWNSCVEALTSLADLVKRASAFTITPYRHTEGGGSNEDSLHPVAPEAFSLMNTLLPILMPRCRQFLEALLRGGMPLLDSLFRS